MLALVTFVLVKLGPAIVANLRPRDVIVANIEKSIRATFPTFCAAPGSRMVIESDEQTRALPLLFNTWEVTCDPNPAPWKEMFARVDIVTCEVKHPWTMTVDWSVVWNIDFTENSKLAVCP